MFGCQQRSSPSRLPNPRKRRRPQGLWQARVTHGSNVRAAKQPQPPRARVPASTPADSDDSDDEYESALDSSRSSKRLRSSTSNTSVCDEEGYDQAPPEVEPPRVSGWLRRTKIMDSCSLATRGTHTMLSECDYEDWEDLKDLYKSALDQLDSDIGDDDPSEALPLLRGVVHECHRFLLRYDDPSVIFITPPSRTRLLQPAHPKPKHPELPTAFHNILGTALFLFGNIISLFPKRALPGEPTIGVPYWLAALDVFETAESLPTRTDGRFGFHAPEDWHMAVVWGRTWVRLAQETLNRSADNAKGADLFSTDYAWPANSPLAAIMSHRPPVTRRTALCSPTPNDLMELAMDQFSRGIFHMPHPQHHHGMPHLPEPPIMLSTLSCPMVNNIHFSQHEHDSGEFEAGPRMSPPPPAPILSLENHHYSPIPPKSRATHLYTIAAEVVHLAEKLALPSERRTWATWADSVFNQMRMEVDMDRWRTAILRERGRCWLIVGSALAETAEQVLEADADDAMKVEEALAADDTQQAREALDFAIEFLDKAIAHQMSSASSAYSMCSGRAGKDEEHEEMALTSLLAEALLTLANITPDDETREELYRRASVVGGEDVKEMLEHPDEFRMEV
ncbi:hypothetical protein K525DRAFT_254976, partial [Schizophyllum commune Loenen D]